MPSLDAKAFITAFLACIEVRSLELLAFIPAFLACIEKWKMNGAKTA
jgi:hypothetical protein